METRERFIKRWRNNLEVGIKFDKKRSNKEHRNRKMRLADLSARLKVGINTILLEVINEDEDRFYRLYHNHMTNLPFKDWPIMRSCACAVVTDGRTMRISSLSDEEVQKVRELLIRFIDEYVEDFRNKIAC